MVPTPTNEANSTNGAGKALAVCSEKVLDEAAGFYGALHRADAPPFRIRLVWRFLPLPVFHRRWCTACNRRWMHCRYAQMARGWQTAGHAHGRATRHA